MPEVILDFHIMEMLQRGVVLAGELFSRYKIVVLVALALALLVLEIYSDNIIQFVNSVRGGGYMADDPGYTEGHRVDPGYLSYKGEPAYWSKQWQDLGKRRK